VGIGRCLLRRACSSSAPIPAPTTVFESALTRMADLHVSTAHLRNQKNWADNKKSPAADGHRGKLAFPSFGAEQHVPGKVRGTVSTLSKQPIAP
jgi:hypothetical protein